MIGKIRKGKGFRGLLNYLLEQEGALIIGGNMAGRNPRELAAEFRAAKELNPGLKNCVFHASLSMPPSQALDRNTWADFTADYMEMMGFEGSQWVLVRHPLKDKDRGDDKDQRDHAHIAASRIRLTDGSTVRDSFDGYKSQYVLRILEAKYGLEVMASSWEVERNALKTGQVRRKKRELEEYAASKRSTPPEVPIQKQLQETIDRATTKELTMPQLINHLKDQGINAQVSFYSTGRVQGITYELDGVRFSGTQLGRAYTFPGLQKHRGISYDSTQNEALAHRTRPMTVQPNPLLEETRRTQLRGALLADYLNLQPVQRQFGKRYTAYWSDDQLVSVTGSDSSEIIRARSKDEHSLTVGSPQRAEAHEKDFQEIALPLQQERAAVIAPIAYEFFELCLHQGKVKQINPSTWRIEGTHYILTLDQSTRDFCVQAKDGRGELLRLTHRDGDKVELVQGIEQKDVANFQHIQQIITQAQEKDLPSPKGRQSHKQIDLD